MVILWVSDYDTFRAIALARNAGGESISLLFHCFNRSTRPPDNVSVYLYLMLTHANEFETSITGRTPIFISSFFSVEHTD